MDTASDAVLTARGLGVRFRTDRGEIVATEGVDLDVRPGELVAILGESGSGKTVTARAIMGIEDERAIVHADELRLGATSLLDLDAEARRRLQGDRIAMVLQNALSSLNPVLRVGDQIGEILRAHRRMSQRARRARAVELLELVGIADAARRVDDFPHQFSGGMRQRILIAMAIALEPDVLVADEPTTALDVTVQAQILRLLHDLRRRLDMGVVLITHDIGVVMEVADRLVIMHDGRVVEHGDADELFARPREDYSRRLLAAATTGRTRELERDAARVLEVRGLRRTFRLGSPLRRHDVQAVRGVDLELRAGETLGIVGESGSGKSTLARMIVGLEHADEGTVRYRDEDVTRRAGRGRHRSLRGIEMVFQDPYTSLDPRMRVEDVVAEPLAVCRTGTRVERRERVAELLRLVGLSPDHMHRFPHQFSGGQRQRIGIARALIRDPEVLVCDEPVSALDVTIQAQVIELLVELQERLGIGMLFISHDLSVVRDLAHRVLVMHRGEAVEHGDVEPIFERPAERYTQELLASAPPARREDRGRLIAA